MDKRYQVFVSSTYNDLIEERKEATQAILKCSCFPAGMELFPASNKEQWSIIKQVIDDSDFYLLIIAGRYGSLGIDDFGEKIGYTGMEFNYALLRGKPIIVMLHRHPENLPEKLTEKARTNKKRLEKFREKAMSGRMVAFWENKDQLNSEILSSLHKMIVNTPETVGWIRADTMPEKNDAEESEISLIIEKFSTIDRPDEKICYLEKHKNLNECFENVKFLKEFSELINIRQSDHIICGAIDLIPFFLGYKPKKRLKSMLDLKSLFIRQCKDGKVQDTELSGSVILLLRILGMYSLNYSEPILNSVKAGNLSLDRKFECRAYISECRCYSGRNQKGEELIEYIMCELKNEHRKMATNDLAYLLTTICDGEDLFDNIYCAFKSSNRSVKEEIIYNIFQHCGASMLIETPRMQRMFLDMGKDVLLWEDDRIKADWLLYCLFTRTYDIFTVDEVFHMTDEFSDDVFYMFFWGVGHGRFIHDAGEDACYTLTDDEKHRVTQVIKNRNHPREKKLLERLNS